MSVTALRRRAMVVVPIVGLVVLVATLGSTPSGPIAALLVPIHVALVIVAVGHAEAIAHRIGEPFGTLVLAVAVTIIEVSLVLMLMISKPASTETLARDTVFAAIMIVCNGVVGLSIIARSRREHVVTFNQQGANALLGTVIVIATLSLVLPSFTSSAPGSEFTPSQFAFAAASAFTVYGVFIFVQTVRHRWMFLSPEALEDESDDDLAHVTAHPSSSGGVDSLAGHVTLLVVSLIGVIGLAKVLAPRIEETVAWFGAPQSFVGVVIAIMILLPESVAAVRAANRGEMQTSLNLSIGSALASIGLTIPAIAIASIWLDGQIILGLGPKEVVLLALTAVIGALTFGSGRATILQGAQHLSIFSSFVFLSIVP